MKNSSYDVIIESKRDKSFHYFLILCGGLFFVAFSVWIFMTEHQDILATSINTAGFLVFLTALGLFPIYYILAVDKIIVFKDHIAINSFCGYTKIAIQLQDIVSWNEIIVRSKYGTFKKLIIRTGHFKYKIEQHNYANYSQLKYQLIKGKSEGGDSQEKHDRKANNFMILLIILSTILILALFINDHY